MKKVSILLMALVMSALMLLAVGCEGSASCQEECEESSDCAAGLSCENTYSYGRACVPEDCGTCFADGDSCNFQSYLDENDERQCDFNYCD